MRYDAVVLIEDGQVVCASSKCPLDCPHFWACKPAQIILKSELGKDILELKQKIKRAES